MDNKRIPGGLLVAIEGIDGAGKTTLVSTLQSHFMNAGIEVVVSKEPTNGPWGKQLRETAQSGRLTPDMELHLLLMDREEHVGNLIQPALAAGAIIFLDRYFYSSIAYQGAAGIHPEKIREANLQIAPEPDLLILLDLTPATGLRRIDARGDTANEFEKPETLEMARSIFLQQTPTWPCGIVIDAEQSVDVVANAALGAVLARIAEKFVNADGLTIKAAEQMLDAMGPTWQRA